MKTYKGVDFRKYGVIDCESLEQREKDFYDLFESIVKEQQEYLRRLIDEQHRIQNAKNILNNINKRKKYENN